MNSDQSSKTRHHIGIALSGLIITLLTLITSTINAEEATWRTIENMSAADRALFDPATSSPRDSTLDYIPAEPYPFEAPYTAEEMGFRSSEFVHVARWPHTMVDVFGVTTSSGYINQGASVAFVTTGGRPGLQGYIHDIKPGEVYSKWVLYSTFPPEAEGAQQLWLPFRSDKTFRTKMDFFIYSPQLRRVRRQPEPRRSQRFPDNAQTFDDVVGRDAWEFEWQLLGTDVLYQTLRFPNTRPNITLNIEGKEFVERPTASLKLMGDTFEHYRADGGVDCWVIIATAKPDWLPGYQEKYLVLWLEKNTFYPLRREKYATDGHLMMIEERLAEKHNPALGEFGYAALASTYWNIDYDLIGYSFHDAHRAHEWTAEQEDMIFTAEFMRREWLFEPSKSQALLDAPDQTNLRPHLYPEKFPAVRNVTLPPEVDARYRAQEAAGRVVFETAE